MRLIIFTFILLFCASSVAIDRKIPGLLPSPQMVEWSKEVKILKSVHIKSTFKKSTKTEFAIKELESILKQNNIVVSNNAKFKIYLKLGEVDAPYQKDEAYKLSVAESGINLIANSDKGLFFGIQTIRQLIVQEENTTTIALSEIKDYPAFKIRGFMHDVGRNFQSIKQIKQHIDLMSLYKYNIFHWHLTDHFGWRLESKAFPELQSKKAFGRHHGKYYTQKEFKEVIEYSRLRNITILPEFDGPGHSEAFRHGLGFNNMKDPDVIPTMVKLIDELATLAPKEVMPYIHIGTDEVRHSDEEVNNDYLPAIHAAVRKNGRRVIGWWKGMHIPGDKKQIQQTWAYFEPIKGNPQIDSRSNYVNHLTPLDAPIRSFFQQPCRAPHGDNSCLGGILAYWPDLLISSEEVGLKISPVYISKVAYAEAIWKGINKNHPEYWAIIPPKGTREYNDYVNFESRLIEHRDRFLSHLPYHFVKSSHIPWKVTPTLTWSDAKNMKVVEKDKQFYESNGKEISWSKQIYHGGTIHVRHFFNFGAIYYKEQVPENHTTIYAQTYIYSPKSQIIDAWISFNTTSTSDTRAGATVNGQWNVNPANNIWVNGKQIPPPKWNNPNRNLESKEIPISDEVFTNRKPSKITLNKGWNRVVIRSADSWKWSFTFTPIIWNGSIAQEVPGLKFSTYPMGLRE